MIFPVKNFKVGCNSNAKFKQMHEYLLDAKKQISYFCKRFYPSYLVKMINDEDCISIIAYANMLADWRYNPNDKTTRNSFVNFYALCFIKTIIKKLSKNRNVDIDISEFYSLVDEKAEKYNEQRVNREILELYLSKLSLKHADIVKSRYFDNKNLDEIGAEHNMSKQRVHQIIIKSIKKMQTATCEAINKE